MTKSNEKPNVTLCSLMNLGLKSIKSWHKEKGCIWAGLDKRKLSEWKKSIALNYGLNTEEEMSTIYINLREKVDPKNIEKPKKKSRRKQKLNLETVTIEQLKSVVLSNIVIADLKKVAVKFDLKIQGDRRLKETWMEAIESLFN